MKTQPNPIARLRASVVTFGKADVDEEAGIIRNVCVMEIGPARGHGFQIDAITLEQVASLINASGEAGVKTRFKHPEDENADDLGHVIGHVVNARVEGNAVRADLHLGDYAECLPEFGDVKTYLIRRAKANPSGFGLSAVIVSEYEPVNDPVPGVVARVFEVQAVDVVGQGAATPNGLLSAKPAPTWRDKFAASLASMNQPNLKRTGHRVCAALNKSIK